MKLKILLTFLTFTLKKIKTEYLTNTNRIFKNTFLDHLYWYFWNF